MPGRRPALLAVLVLAGLLVACNRSQPPAAGPGGAMPPMPVTVLQVTPQKVPVMVETVGTLEGVREVEVRARVGGVLQQQFFREGEPVRAGAALYRIERAPFEIGMDAARAGVAQAEARVEQARRENGRLAALVAERAISQREADDAASALKTAEAALQTVRTQVREAQLNLGYTEVTAPIAGLAQRSQRSVGALVTPAADGGLLTTIVQTNPIRLRFALSEAEATQLRQGQGRQVRLLLPDGQSARDVGRLDFAGSVVDARLGTVQMRAEFPNPAGAWLPGQFVRAQVITGEQEAFLVPQSAVMSGDQGRFVWVVGADGKAAAKPVQTGPWQGSDWVIRSGLAAGDQVITNNLIKLRPGAPVQATAAGAAASGAPASASAPASAVAPASAAAPVPGPVPVRAAAPAASRPAN